MSEPTKIYIVTQGDYSDCRNIGVFTSREKAEAAGGDTVEEWLLDNVQGAPGHYDYFFLVMNRDGAVHSSQTTIPFGEIEDPCPVQQWPSGKNPLYGCWEFHVWATDLTHAIKIVNEQRAQLIAENKWGVE